MADEKFDNLQLLGRHVPDESIERDERGQPFSVALPGTYEVGVNVGGTFVTLGVVKAGNILNADGSAKNPAPESPPTDSEQSPSDPGDDAGK